MSSKHELVWLDGSDRALALNVAQLHCRALPHSPLARLGERFLADCYYLILPREHLIEVLVSLVDGRLVGFIALTADADQFMMQAIRRRPWNVLVSLAYALASDPRRLSAIFEGLAISRHRSRESAGGGELLSFAVDDSVRDARFIRSSGVRVTSELLEGAVGRLKDRGVSRIRSLVDADNRPVRILYRALGWRQISGVVPGWRAPQVEFVHEGTAAEEL